MHEVLKPKAEFKAGSDRSFGLIFATVFLIVCVWPWIFHGEPIRFWALGTAISFVVVAFTVPRLLSPLNKVWFRFGLLLHRVVSPLVMGVLYYCAFVPMGLILQALGKDLLRLKRDRNVQSYWIDRESIPSSGSMSKQF